MWQSVSIGIALPSYGHTRQRRLQGSSPTVALRSEAIQIHRDVGCGRPATNVSPAIRAVASRYRPTARATDCVNRL